MDFEDLCMKAYKQEGISKYASLPERHTYLRLQELYERYRCKDFDKEKAMTIKNKIQKQYENDKREYDDSFEICKTYNKRRIDNSDFLFELEKEKDIHKALELCIKIISNCMGDNAMVDRFKGKFPN